MHAGFLISQTTWSSSPEAAQRASPLPPRLARTIGWLGKHSGSLRGLLGPGGGQGPEHSPPSPGQGWPMARALEPSQPRCPGLSPPGSPRPPGCTLIGAVPGLLVTPARPREADPALALCWAHRNTAGAHRAAGRRGSCGNTPPFWLQAWRSGCILPTATPRGCLAPAPPRLPPGCSPLAGPTHLRSH